MNTLTKLFAIAAMVVVGYSAHGAATVAPTTLPDCIIQFSTKIQINMSAGTRTVLFRPDNTYLEIAVTATGPLGNSSGTPHTGTFAYTVDPQNAAHGTIIYDGGLGELPNEELYFGTPTTGAVGAPPPLSTGGPTTSFTLYARKGNTGGTNFSTRNTLGENDTTICGFVIGGTGARWVLLRSVGASLKSFGVSPVVAGSSFTAYDAQQSVVGTSVSWSADPNLVRGYKQVSSLVGAFPLIDGSDDSILFVALAPGAYTMTVKAARPGNILCEAYLLPY
jgi:hypothetical protein